MNKIKIYIISNDTVFYNSDYLTEEQKEQAKIAEVEQLPYKEGYVSQLKWNYTEGTAEYVYVKEEKTEIGLLKAENQKLRESQAEQDLLIMQLMLGGM